MMNVEQKFLRIKAGEYEGLYVLFCFVVESREFSLAVHSLHFSGALILTETNALLVPTLSERTTGIGKALLFNCTEAVGLSS
jgi:hypothetical protein